MLLPLVNHLEAIYMSPTLQVPMLEKLVKELPDLLQRNTDLLTGDNIFGFHVKILHDVIKMIRTYVVYPRE